ncbi:MAG TPA: TatD family hydrolase [Terriglobia bacterium]|nr:TatD family hydrolase [Terriglobia bacterium]
MAQFLVDSHCHLDDAQFDADREKVIERARAQGLRWLLTVGGGSGPDDLAVGVPIAARYDWIYTSAGIHPHEAQRADKKHLDRLRQAASEPKVIAVGEIGLDYYYDHSPREVQKQVLVSQLEIAEEAKLPVIIHCRDAWADLKEMVGSHCASRGLRGILHCFTGTREEAFRFLDWGFLISFAGNVTFKKADSIRAVAAEIPLNRMLAETDSPYLAPVPNRGKRNEPAYVREVTRQLADLRHLSLEEMGALITKNFEDFFGLG